MSVITAEITRLFQANYNEKTKDRQYWPVMWKASPNHKLFMYERVHFGKFYASVL